MKIRPAHKQDAPIISNLLSQMDYPNIENFLAKKIESLAESPLDYNLVLEDNESIIGFMSLHIIPQIALDYNFLRISYLVVDQNCRSKGAGKFLENYAEHLAKENNCDRIELHSHFRREKAHQFYYRQGYEESPKYLMKKRSTEN